MEVHSGGAQWRYKMEGHSGVAMWRCTVDVHSEMFSGGAQWSCKVEVHRGVAQLSCTVEMHSGGEQLRCTKQTLQTEHFDMMGVGTSIVYFILKLLLSPCCSSDAK